MSYLRRLPRAAPAGTRWNYSTGETNLVGIPGAGRRAPLAQYLSEKIWGPAGMEQQATWILSKTGREISGCCIQAASRDFARFGVFVLNGARVGGQAIAPDGWLEEATSKRADIGRPGRGYGYQWWTYDDGSFAARGIFGQGIFIDPKRKLVIASNADWGGGASDPAASDAREAFYRAVQQAIDDEGKRRCRGRVNDQRATRRSQRGSCRQRCSTVCARSCRQGSSVAPCPQRRPLRGPLLAPLLPRQQRPLSARSAPPLHATALCATVVLPRERVGPCAEVRRSSARRVAAGACGGHGAQGSTRFLGSRRPSCAARSMCPRPCRSTRCSTQIRIQESPASRAVHFRAVPSPALAPHADGHSPAHAACHAR
ncbi:MAG: serine hydrolase [Rubrivivax sp.]